VRSHLKTKAGMVVHACDSSYVRGIVRGSQSEASSGKNMRPI
jgi:hypothetical protein